MLPLKYKYQTRSRCLIPTLLNGGRFQNPLLKAIFVDLHPLTMSTTSLPKISSQSFFIHLPPHQSLQPIHVTLTQLLPSTSFLLHITSNPKQPRLSDVLVVSMPRGNEVLSSRLEGLGGLEEDMDRLSRLLGISLQNANYSKAIKSAMFRFGGSSWNCARDERRSGTNTVPCR